MKPIPVLGNDQCLEESYRRSYSTDERREQKDRASRSDCINSEATFVSKTIPTTLLIKKSQAVCVLAHAREVPNSCHQEAQSTLG